ncbi:hypothetical protein ACN47E_004278 [Coniothyrium glycines]
MFQPHLPSQDAPLSLPALHQPHVDIPRRTSIPDTPSDVGTPGPGTLVPRALTEPPINDFSSLLDSSLPHPVPLPPASSLQPVQSPATDDRPYFDLTFAALPSTHVSLPAPTVVKSAHNLRLPSFDALGIAAPHPDRFPLHSTHSFSSLGAGPLSKPEDPLHALSPPLALPYQVDGTTHLPVPSPKATRQVDRIVPTFTPPSEPGAIAWGAFVNLAALAVGSPPSSDPGATPDLDTAASTTIAGHAPIVVPTTIELSGEARMAAWIHELQHVIARESGCLDMDFIKILSHALPCPSLTGHIFGRIIATIHEQSSANTSWINVFHALPGRYTLSDLPKSPPSTPGPAVGGDSYFTSKVFDSAVAIPDYQLDSKLLPPSPRPVVPPGSINVSVVERYIPPTNTNEFAEMFTFRGRSLLYDRLVELSRDNGILLFVYPTRTGARTFMKQYLGPILDPLLRTLTVVHDLHSELGRNLGQMSSVNYLDEYDSLESQVRRFCNALSLRPDSSGKRAVYEVIHAAREQLVLERSAWADDWWIKQEKHRVREVITKYFRKSKRLPSNEMTGAHLIQEVLEGVSNRECPTGDPSAGVELGVFVVKKKNVA